MSDACKKVSVLLAASLCVTAGAFSAVAEDAFWINTKTDTSADNHYNSDQYVVGKEWKTAANWLGGVAPAASVDTVRFTNLVENGVGYRVQPIKWDANQSIARLIGDPKHPLVGVKSATTMTIGDASDYDGVLRILPDNNQVGNPVAGYAFSASTDVPRFAADGFPQLKVADAGHRATLKSVYGRGTILKTGAGAIKILDGSNRAKVRLEGGSLELPGHDYPDELVAGYEGNFDASAPGALETVSGDREYVTRWNASNNSQYYFKTTNDVMRPYLRANYANGKPVVDFGAFKGVESSPGIGEERWGELGLPAFMEGQKTLSMKSVFYVQEETSRTNNGAVAFGNHGGTVFYRMYDNQSQGYVSPTWSGVLSGWYMHVSMQHGDMRVNNMRVPHDHYEPGGLARMMVYSQSEYAPEQSLQYIHMLGCDRYYRFGGVRLGQLVSYNKTLTTEEIRQNNAHLAKKWLGPVAEAVDADVGAVFVTKNANAISVPAEATAIVPSVAGGVDAVNGLVKNGAGTLVLDEVNLETSKITVNGGKIAFRDLVAKTAPADNAPAAEPCFWLKAANDDGTLSDSLVTETVNGTNFVSRWNDCRNNGRYAYVPAKYGKCSPDKPYVTANAANGKPVVDFGLHDDYAAGKIPAMLFNRDGSNADVAGVQNAMEAFVMFRHKDADKYQSWIFTSAAGQEFVNSFSASNPASKHRILNFEYGDRRVLGADWFRDGRRIDPQDCTVDSDYHVLNFAAFDTLKLEALSIDRWQSYDTRGGGIEVCEYIVFDRILTDAERRQTEAYLLKKWKNAAHPRTAAKKVGTLAFANGVTPEVENAGETAIGEIVTTSDTLKLTGSGTVTLTRPLPPCVTKIDAGAVKLVQPTTSVAMNIIGNKCVLNLDASRADTMTFDLADPTRVLEWRDANGGDYVAVKSHLASNTPQLTDVLINGQPKKSICLFDWCLTPAGKSYSDYQAPTNLATGFDLRKKTAASWSATGGFDAQEFFVVMADYDSANKKATHRANVYDSAPNDSPCPYRETDNTGNIVRLDYGRDPNYTMRVMLDGSEVEANKNVKANRGKIVDFDYHVVTLSVTNSTKTIHTSTVGWTKTGGSEWIWAGKSVAEIIAFTKPLSDEERAIVHDHLRKKWQTADVDLPKLAVDEIALKGGELDYGESEIVAEAVSGSGTVRAQSLELAEDGELEFTFTDVDQVGAITVDGTFVLPDEFGVRIVADPATLKLKAGSYTLLTADSLVGAVDGASVTAELANGRTVRVYKVGNALKAQVYQPGVMIIVR